jgi:hypothetical protein
MLYNCFNCGSGIIMITMLLWFYFEGKKDPRNRKLVFFVILTLMAINTVCMWFR